MADFYGTQDVAPPVSEAQAPSGISIANLLGAVISLSLVIGVGVWGYKLLVRDVSGIPVVRALDGPMRVQPENPGGQQAQHQGLAVNAVAALGTAEAPADRLMLAPRPVELTDEDAMPAADAVPNPDTDAAEDRSAEISDAVRAGSVEALVAELTLGIKPLSKPVTRAEASQVAAPIVAPEPLAPEQVVQAAVAAVPRPAAPTPAAPQPAAAVIDAPGVALSPRPRIRPAGPRTVQEDQQAQIIQAAVAAAVPLDVSPETIPVGTRLVQLGAFDTTDIARAEWDRLAARFGDYMDGKSRVVQQASSGGRTFYRLRAMGFDDLSDARRFCSALVSEGADCIPVVTR